MAQFIPKRIIIKPQARTHPKTKEIIQRVQRFNPDVEIEYLETKRFVYPVKKPIDKFNYMNESVIISERSESFIRTFDSPGNIVESLTTVFNLAWMCVHKCEYCYLQTNQTPEHYFYANLQDAEHEIAAAPIAHTAILTLWMHLENYFGVLFNKLPDRFKEASDWLREYFVNARINRDERAIDTYYGIQQKLVEQLNKDNKSYNVDIKAFRRSRETITQWYQQNQKYNLKLTSSEFTDLLAVDHLTGISTFLMQMVQKYPRVSYTLRTKSAYVDEILKFDGCGRMKIQIGMNTQFAIREYEHGTASLEERLQAARRVQQASGFVLDIIIEPMLTYKNYEKEYLDLVRRVLKELDPKRIHSITLGTARYAPQLMAMAQMHYPNTTLFDHPHVLIPPQKPDVKYRYHFETRVKLYSSLIKELELFPQIQIKLGAEEPGIWNALKLNKEIELGNPNSHNINVPPPTSNPMSKQKAKTKATPPVKNVINGEDDIIPYWHSIATQDILIVAELHQMKNQSVPVQKASEAARQLNGMMYIKREQVKNEEEYIGVPIHDDWIIEKSSTIGDAIKNVSFFTPIKIVGKIINVSPAEPHEMIDGSTLGFVRLEISDHKDYTLKTLLIDVSKISVDVNSLCKAKTRCTFFGSIVPMYLNSGKSEFYFYLHDFIPSTSHLDLVEWAPHGEYEGNFRYRKGDKIFGIHSDHPSVIIRQNNQFNGILKYIKKELTDNYGIVGLDKAKGLDRALEFVILQAFSHGKNEYLEKLHALVIGTPNVGKAYLTNAALALNPIGQEISSSSQKITFAGLVGTVTGGKKSKSERGILPQNNGGVVCIQEFHDVLGAHRKAVCGLFVRMMEEGKVTESTSAATVHPTETALLIDQNPYDEIDPAGNYNAYTRIGIPIHMLSRFDYILEIRRDKERSAKIASEMTRSLDTGKKSQEWKERCRYLIAFLKDQYKIRPFDRNIRQYIDNQVTALLEQLPKTPRHENLIEDMRLRMVRSVFKITKAIATANATSIATKEHVDYAMMFLRDKVSYISQINLDDIKPELPSIDDVEKRKSLLLMQFARKKFSIGEAKAFLEKNMVGEFNNRRLQRDLKELGAKPEKKPKGSWSLD